jgi:hypothetical protein
MIHPRIAESIKKVDASKTGRKEGGNKGNVR